MKNVILLTLFLSFCLLANGQDYLQLANDCFDKGDYECAKRNYTFFQTFDGKDMSEQIKKADECMRTLLLADEYFKDEEWEKAMERYQIVLEKNPKDAYTKKQFELCEEYLKPANDRLQLQSQESAQKSESLAVENRSKKNSVDNIYYTPLIKKEKKFYYGLKLGLNISNVVGVIIIYGDNIGNYQNKELMHGGIFGEFRFNKFSKFSIQPELIYSRQGIRGVGHVFYDGFNRIRYDYEDIDMNYYTIPIMAKYYVIDGLSIEIGPQLDFYDQMNALRDIDFSLNFGVSYQIPRFPLGFYLRYSLGLTDNNIISSHFTYMDLGSSGSSSVRGSDYFYTNVKFKLFQAGVCVKF